MSGGGGRRKGLVSSFMSFMSNTFFQEVLSPNRPPLMYYCSESHHMFIPKTNQWEEKLNKMIGEG